MGQRLQGSRRTGASPVAGLRQACGCQALLLQPLLLPALEGAQVLQPLLLVQGHKGTAIRSWPPWAFRCCLRCAAGQAASEQGAQPAQPARQLRPHLLQPSQAGWRQLPEGSQAQRQPSLLLLLLQQQLAVGSEALVWLGRGAGLLRLLLLLRRVLPNKRPLPLLLLHTGALLLPRCRCWGGALVCARRPVLLLTSRLHAIPLRTLHAWWAGGRPTGRRWRRGGAAARRRLRLHLRQLLLGAAHALAQHKVPHFGGLRC